MTINQAFKIASKNIGGEMESSALVRLHLASDCIDRGLYNYAWENILKSLFYSVGAFHKDYIFVKESYDLEMQAMEI